MIAAVGGAIRVAVAVGERVVASQSAAPTGLRESAPCPCPSCDGDFVTEVGREAAGASLQRLQLRCAVCETVYAWVLTPKQIQLFAQHQAAHRHALITEADRLEHEVRTAEIDLFVAALERDLIDAGDFAPRKQPAAAVTPRRDAA